MACRTRGEGRGRMMMMRVNGGGWWEQAGTRALTTRRTASGVAQTHSAGRDPDACNTTRVCAAAPCAWMWGGCRYLLPAGHGAVPVRICMGALASPIRASGGTVHARYEPVARGLSTLAGAPHMHTVVRTRDQAAEGRRDTDTAAPARGGGRLGSALLAPGPTTHAKPSGVEGLVSFALCRCAGWARACLRGRDTRSVASGLPMRLAAAIGKRARRRG
ncbi:hypothetical protein B0H11DRAFT_1337831 [Mycena galericulata]|nr:hypothetical protein B0H11DRAFT_1337831 [Mycena galericulata]